MAGISWTYITDVYMTEILCVCLCTAVINAVTCLIRVRKDYEKHYAMLMLCQSRAVL